MTDKIRVDIVSDVVCPWCIIGYKRLEKAIVELDAQDKIEINWQPFELNPDMPKKGENIIEHMNHKYGMSKEQVQSYQTDRKENGKEFGFEYNYYEDMKIVNTRDAHILLEYASEIGKQHQLHMRLFSAHFSEAKDISDTEVLINEAKSIGMNELELLNILEDSTYKNEIQEKENYWLRRGVSSVPTMIFNGTMLMNGAYPMETYKQVIAELIKENNE